MTRDSEIQQLDRFIEALRCGEHCEIDALADPELAELCALAVQVRRLRETEWPAAGFAGQAVDRLAHDLSDPADLDDFTVEVPARPRLPESLPNGRVEDDSWWQESLRGRGRRRWLRQGLEMAAAGLVLVLVTSLLVSVLGGRGDESGPAAVGSQPVTSAPTPTVAPTPTPLPPTPTHPVAPTPIAPPALTALQGAVGFPLYAPAWLPDGVQLEPPRSPMQLPGFTSVQLNFVDAAGHQVLQITEASPYQHGPETMPAEEWNGAVEQAIGDRQVRIYETDTEVSAWWQEGDVGIRVDSYGGEGGAAPALSRDDIVNVVRSMAPVAAPDGPTSEVPPEATIRTEDDAVARAEEALTTIGGRADAAVRSVRLVTVDDLWALGLERADGIEPGTAVWLVEFDDALVPPDCPGAGNSVCSHGDVTIVLDAVSGDILGWRDALGAWQQLE